MFHCVRIRFVLILEQIFCAKVNSINANIYFDHRFVLATKPTINLLAQSEDAESSAKQRRRKEKEKNISKRLRYSAHIVRPFKVSHSFHFILDNYKYFFLFFASRASACFVCCVQCSDLNTRAVRFLWRKSNIKTIILINCERSHTHIRTD